MYIELAGEKQVGVLRMRFSQACDPPMYKPTRCLVSTRYLHAFRTTSILAIGVDLICVAIFALLSTLNLCPASEIARMIGGRRVTQYSLC